MKNLKQKIRNGETLYGCWLNLGSSLTAEIVGNAGYDWALIDLEHGAGSEKDVLYQLQGLEHTPCAAVVRVESYERQRSHRVLDYGAEGIMCPRINTPEEAQKAVDALRYQPEGVRGVATMNRATQYGVNFSKYHSQSKEKLVGIIQIESSEVLKVLDDVASIDGVDVLFIGPSDLSMALGVFGQFDHPLFIEAIQATSQAAKKAKKAAGILLPNPNEFTKYFDLGYRFIACSSDSVFVRKGAQETLDILKSHRASIK